MYTSSISSPASSSASAVRLLASGVVQRPVGVALEAPLAVPVGLAVAYEEQLGHAASRLAPWISGLRDRVCVVTGSTGGIGLETGRLLADEGARVVTSGRSHAPERGGGAARLGRPLARRTRRRS